MSIENPIHVVIKKKARTQLELLPEYVRNELLSHCNFVANDKKVKGFHRPLNVSVGKYAHRLSMKHKGRYYSLIYALIPDKPLVILHVFEHKKDNLSVDDLNIARQRYSNLK